MKDNALDKLKSARRGLREAIKESDKNVMLYAMIKLDHAKTLLELADSYIAWTDEEPHDRNG